MSGRTRLAVVGALLCLQAFVAAPNASAVTCNFDPSTHIATVSRAGTSGGTLAISNNAGFLRVAGIDCGKVGPLGDPQAVDKVVIDMAGGCCEALLFSLNGGPLGPGFTNESNGTSEIEFEVSNVTGVNQLGVFGTGAGETITAGQSFLQAELIFVETLNMNADVEPGFPGSSRDNDVIIRGIPEELALIGNGGNDTLRADGTGTIFSNPATADVVLSDGAGADTTAGGNGDDTLLAENSAASPDSFQGGLGRDFLDMSDRTGNTAVTLDGVANDGQNCPATCEGDNIGPDVEVVRTGTGNDHLVGRAGGQDFDGGAGTDVLEGRGGSDLLAGGTGADDLRGGKGFDFASFWSSSDGVVVSIDGDADDGPLGEHDNVRMDIEGVYGGFNDDHLSGNAKNNKLFGGSGDDTLRGGGGNDQLHGGRSPFGHVFYESNGSDDFFGGPGVDTVVQTGLQGAMTISLDNLANDVVNGQAVQGIDNIHTDVENVIGGPAADSIRGSLARNVILGGAGNDKLFGLGGNDLLKGEAGNDRLNGGAGLDACRQGPGTGARIACES